jgi:hypothetical protein
MDRLSRVVGVTHFTRGGRPSLLLRRLAINEEDTITMRMHFEPDEVEEFEAAKDLLLRRSSTWANQHGMAADSAILSAALDFRHDSIDGRLGFWTTSLVHEFLLTWMPRTLTITADEAADAPDTLCTLLRYLHHTDLADPTGDSVSVAETAVTTAESAFRREMSDERNFGLAKFWIMKARESGVDTTDDAAMRRFIDKVRTGTIPHDEDLLQHIVKRHVLEPNGPVERAFPQPPQSLPPYEELVAAAEESPVVQRLRTFTEWVGSAGRPLTKTGQLTLADARDVSDLLGTKDVIDPMIGDRVFRTRSSTELAELTLIVEWAKKVRLVRVVKNRLVQIAKNRSLLRDGLALWNKAFDTVPDLREALLTPSSHGGTGPLFAVFADVVPDILNTLYGFCEPVPVVRMTESAWLACQEVFLIEDRDEQELWRRTVQRDLERTLRMLAELGAVELSAGHADPVFRTDLDADFDPGDGGPALPAEARERLRAAFAPDAEPVELVRLTPLGTQGVHTSLIAQGRCAPLVGELANATPAQLLGVIAERYSRETGREEIAHWLAAHGDAGTPDLIDAVRGCSFRSRAAAMLDVLADAQPDRTTFLRRLRSDDALGPIAIQFLLTEGNLSHDDLTERDELLGLTEQLLQLFEIAGPEAARETLTAEGIDPQNMLSAALHSGHPNAIGLSELRTLVAEPLRYRERLDTHPLAGVSRSTRRPKQKRKRKR